MKAVSCNQRNREHRKTLCPGVPQSPAQYQEKHTEKCLCIDCSSPRGFQMCRDTRDVEKMVDPCRSVARMRLHSLRDLKTRDNILA